jgi:3-methylfumaryl-CoA hydratase
VLFQPLVRQSALGADGHPVLGEFLPAVPLPRRMFVGIDVTMSAPLRIGDRVRRTSTIAAITPKQGRSGPLVFVTMEHVLLSTSGGSIREEHRFVFRGEGQAAVSSTAAEPAVAEWERVVQPDPSLLFRFSAATFNAHRIHYDRDYAREKEGYPDLLVPGRLAALLLLELAREHSEAPVTGFAFQAVRPLWVDEPFTLCGRSEAGGAQLWIRGLDGGVRMTAKIRTMEG